MRHLYWTTPEIEDTIYKILNAMLSMNRNFGMTMLPFFENGSWLCCRRHQKYSYHQDCGYLHHFSRNRVFQYFPQGWQKYEVKYTDIIIDYRSAPVSNPVQKKIPAACPLNTKRQQMSLRAVPKKQQTLQAHSSTTCNEELFNPLDEFCLYSSKRFIQRQLLSTYRHQLLIHLGILCNQLLFGCHG